MSDEQYIDELFAREDVGMDTCGFHDFVLDLMGIETTRYVHTHATGVDASGVVNIHQALGFGLLASGALLLSLLTAYLTLMHYCQARW